MLLEAAIAMTIIAICLAMSFAHTSSLLRSDHSAMKLKAKMAFEKMLNSTSLKEESLSFEGFEVLKSVSIYQNHDDLLLVTLTATDDNDHVFLETRHVKRRSDYE